MWAARPALAAGGEQAFVDIPGGSFVKGDAAGEPDEAPRTVFVKPFRLMRFEVTNRQFAAFVAATGHVTDAESAAGGCVWSTRWRGAARTGPCPLLT